MIHNDPQVRWARGAHRCRPLTLTPARCLPTVLVGSGSQPKGLRWTGWGSGKGNRKKRTYLSSPRLNRTSSRYGNHAVALDRLTRIYTGPLDNCVCVCLYVRVSEWVTEWVCVLVRGGMLNQWLVWNKYRIRWWIYININIDIKLSTLEPEAAEYMKCICCLTRIFLLRT